MKKSLVAVLLSLVALTVVAGAAFAGDSFTVKATVDGASEAKTFTVDKLVALSLDVKAGVAIASIDFSTPAISEKAASSIKFALSEDMTLKVFSVKDEKVGDQVKDETISITETKEFVLVASGDVEAYAVKATITFDGGDNPKPTPKYTEPEISKSPKDAVTKATALLGVEPKDGTLYVVASKDITAAELDAINAEFANLLVKVFDIPTSGVEAIIFKITLSGIDANRLLTWLKLALNTVSGPVASIAGSATEIEQVYYISDEGEQIMENNTTKDPNQEVNVAFKVSSGKQAIAVKDEKAPEGGKSPSGGCDMGLLSGLALFAVALLPLRKSK